MECAVLLYFRRTKTWPVVVLMQPALIYCATQLTTSLYCLYCTPCLIFTFCNISAGGSLAAQYSILLQIVFTPHILQTILQVASWLAAQYFSTHLQYCLGAEAGRGAKKSKGSVDFVIVVPDNFANVSFYFFLTVLLIFFTLLLNNCVYRFMSDWTQIIASPCH